MKQQLAILWLGVVLATACTSSEDRDASVMTDDASAADGRDADTFVARSRAFWFVRVSDLDPRDGAFGPFVDTVSIHNGVSGRFLFPSHTWIADIEGAQLLGETCPDASRISSPFGEPEGFQPWPEPTTCTEKGAFCIGPGGWFIAHMERVFEPGDTVYVLACQSADKLVLEVGAVPLEIDPEALWDAKGPETWSMLEPQITWVEVGIVEPAVAEWTDDGSGIIESLEPLIVPPLPVD